MAEAQLIELLHSSPGRAVTAIASLIIVVPILLSLKSEKWGIFSVMGRAYDRWKLSVVAADRRSEARLVHLEDAFDRLEKQLAAVQRKHDSQQDYIVYVTEAVYQWQLRLAMEGRTLPPPPYLTYQEWLTAEPDNS